MNWVFILSIALASVFVGSVIMFATVAGYAHQQRARHIYWYRRYKRLAATTEPVRRQMRGEFL